MCIYLVYTISRCVLLPLLLRPVQINFMLNNFRLQQLLVSSWIFLDFFCTPIWLHLHSRRGPWHSVSEKSICGYSRVPNQFIATEIMWLQFGLYASCRCCILSHWHLECEKLHGSCVCRLLCLSPAVDVNGLEVITQSVAVVGPWKVCRRRKSSYLCMCV